MRIFGHAEWPSQADAVRCERGQRGPFDGTAGATAAHRAGERASTREVGAAEPRHHSLGRLFAAVALGPQAALAASPAPVAAGQAVQVAAGLALVLLLIAAAAWAARRLQGLRPHGRGRIRIIEGLAVGAREKLLLVEVDGSRVLLGMCPGRIATLHTFAGESPPPSFAHALDAARGAPALTLP